MPAAPSWDGLGDGGYRFHLSQSITGWNCSVRTPDGARWYTPYRRTRKGAMGDARRAQNGGQITWTQREPLD
jgi:hypothetical protein